MLPRALVVGIVDHLGLPRALEVGIVNHGGFPLTVILVIPVVWLLGIGIGDLLGNVIVTLRLLVLGIGNPLLINPVIRLGLVRVLDLLRGQEVELILKLSIADGLVVDENLKGVIRADDESVEVGQLIILHLDLLLHEEIIILLVVVEDGVGLLVGGAANVRTEHDGVGSIAAKLLGRELLPAGEQLDVGAAAVNLLLVLDGELDDELLAVGRLEGLG
mmetsp:Transcript_18877/g.41138  ORF Transcript_18877/g.41138 Transcript_18877/m.41138 type:complete len:218 (+) Transcript_18877:545-1198(+)